jgi:hypothetical protein
MAALGGFPLAVASTLETGRMSLFAPSPVLSTVLVVILLLPATRRLLLAWADGELSEQRITAQPAVVGGL